MLEIFRRIDIERRSRRPAGAPIYENPGQRIDDDNSPEEVKKRSAQQEQRIEEILQEIFDLQADNFYKIPKGKKKIKNGRVINSPVNMTKYNP